MLALGATPYGKFHSQKPTNNSIHDHGGRGANLAPNVERLVKHNAQQQLDDGIEETTRRAQREDPRQILDFGRSALGANILSGRGHGQQAPSKRGGKVIVNAIEFLVTGELDSSRHSDLKHRGTEFTETTSPHNSVSSVPLCFQVFRFQIVSLCFQKPMTTCPTITKRKAVPEGNKGDRSGMTDLSGTGDCERNIVRQGE